MNERLDKETQWEDRVAMRLPDVSENEVQTPVRTDGANRSQSKSEMASFAFQIAFYGLIGLGLAEVSYFWKTIWPSTPQSSQAQMTDRQVPPAADFQVADRKNETVTKPDAEAPKATVDSPFTSDPAIADSLRQAMRQTEIDNRKNNAFGQSKEKSSNEIR